MYTSETLATAGQTWKEAADALLDEAERVGPLEPGIFGDLGTDDEGEQVAQQVDARIDALIEAGDSALEELSGADEALDPRFQATSLLVASLATADALALADEEPTRVFSELGLEPGTTVTFADARGTVDQASVILTQGAPLSPDAGGSVPDSLASSLEDIEQTGADEIWAVITSSAGNLAGVALVSGLGGLLSGTAAAEFDKIRAALSRWRDALKRGVVRIAKWVMERLTALLPESLRKKVEALIEQVQEKLKSGAGVIATDLLGQILGRPEAEGAWERAAESGVDLTEAEGKLGGVVEEHKRRIEWVTKGRKVLEKFESIVAAVVAALTAAGKLAFAALAAALLAFVAVQVIDGFNDIEALV